MAIILNTATGRAALKTQLMRLGRPSKAKRRVLRNVAQALKKELRATLNQPGSGRIYPSATGRGLHQASAPGEPPAPDRQALRNSVHDRDRSPDGVDVVVGPHEAAVKLELGTVGGLIAPRPYMAQSLERARPAMLNEVVVGFRTALYEDL